MSYLIKPAGYKALLNLSQTEMGIKKIKDFFQQNLSSELRLRRVTAPLFVLKGMGINDDLNGTERAVTFPIKDLDDSKAEIVHSLAKWKRLTVRRPRQAGRRLVRPVRFQRQSTSRRSPEHVRHVSVHCSVGIRCR